MGLKMLLMNTLKQFQDKKSQVVAIGIIICLSSFLYTATDSAMDTLRSGLDGMLEQTKQEHFSIEMVDGVMPNELGLVAQYGGSEYLGYQLTDLKQAHYPLYRLSSISDNKVLSGFMEIMSWSSGSTRKLTF